jgi:hypothetical protein
VPTKIRLDAKSWTLHCDDAGLFDGHTIEIFAVGDDIRANLLG